VRESVTALIVPWLLDVGDPLQAVVLRRTRPAIRELLSVSDREAWIVLSEAPRSAFHSRKAERVTWRRSTPVRKSRLTVR
jgi:hypothetical protein